MALCSVNDFFSLINQQIVLQEKLELCLLKLKALVDTVLLTDNFFDLDTGTIHSYFLVASDLIAEATDINHDSLSKLHYEIK